MNEHPLYPQENEYRDIRDLNGLWRFQVDWDGTGEDSGWHAGKFPSSAAEVPVPASYNDLFADTNIRDHVGYVWYQRELIIPSGWKDRKILLRFDAVAHHADIWLDGKLLGRNKGGFLPFTVDLGDVAPGGRHLLTVRADNRLDWTCLPGGELTSRPAGGCAGSSIPVQETHFDFFNYSGIHRPVRLIALPAVHITDVSIRTAPGTGKAWNVSYDVSTSSAAEVEILLMNPEGDVLHRAAARSGTIPVENPVLWEPGRGVLYTLEVRLRDSGGKVFDSYREEFGFRSIKVTATTFEINGRPFYFRGFGKHEDADIRGRCLDLATMVHDFALLKWIGANSIRTSHYPYSEEFMRMADRQGLVVIDEVPAVGFNMWNDVPVFCDERANSKTLEHHLDVTRGLIRRDKNHPCVVMWSLGNEPASQNEAAEPYFQSVIGEARRLDASRPITVVEDRWPDQTRIGHLVDVICVNRYFGWYHHTGEMDRIEELLEADLRAWHTRFAKPVMVAEYGADTIHGFHSVMSQFFTEEFQASFLEQYHRVYDRLPFMVGEHVWNFADFATKQGTKRVWGNRKGIFTRQRHPKSAAQILKQRWIRP
ncbi:MAG: beta-glucuronidase [Kiritimatiellaceae bacterium]|nr:beta-glucuronidase [Kiritimatiellaceae bacterium]